MANYHPDVLACHTQFGGDLDAMQALYDRPDHLAALEAQSAKIAELQAHNQWAADHDDKLINRLRGEIADLKRALDTARHDAMEDAATASRFARLHGIVSRLLWLDVGVPAMENQQTKKALDDLAEFLFADGIDAALSASPLAQGGQD